MVTVTLPDGATRTYPAGVTPGDVANDIAKSLGKAAIAARIDGQFVDLSRPIQADAALALITMKDRKEAEELVRHDCAHIMARAVQELWPDVKVTIGPVIANGWYYDFDRAEPFTISTGRTTSPPTIWPRSRPRCARSSPPTIP